MLSAGQNQAPKSEYAGSFLATGRPMTKIRVRVSLDKSVWTAAEAAARAKGINTAEYLETALRCAIDPFETIGRAAELVRGRMLDLAEIADQIRVIADAVVDQWRSDSDEQS